MQMLLLPWFQDSFGERKSTFFKKELILCNKECGYRKKLVKGYEGTLTKSLYTVKQNRDFGDIFNKGSYSANKIIFTALIYSH